MRRCDEHMPMNVIIDIRSTKVAKEGGCIPFIVVEVVLAARYRRVIFETSVGEGMKAEDTRRCDCGGRSVCCSWIF